MKRNILIALFGTSVLAALLVGCQQEVRPDTTAKIDGVKDGEVSIYVKDTARLKFIISPADANAHVTWTCADESVAKVLSIDSVYNTSHRYVELIGLKAGTAAIIATVDGNAALTDTCTLIVKPFPAFADSVGLYKASDTTKAHATQISIEDGCSDTLDYVISPKDVYKDSPVEWSVKWSAGDEKVVAISDGVVAALKHGSTVVYIKVTSKFKTSTVDSTQTIVDSCIVNIGQ